MALRKITDNAHANQWIVPDEFAQPISPRHHRWQALPVMPQRLVTFRRNPYVTRTESIQPWF